MRVLFTCGGTAGHINPALALARLFKERKENCEVLFVGAKGGMEEHLVPQAGYRIETVTVGSFWRKMTWSGITHNARSLQKLQIARQESRRILKDFRPDLVMGTGGYASYPILREAARQGIPTAVHESNSVPGLTTRHLAPHVDCVMTGLPEVSAHYSRAKRVIYTGTPVRGEFFQLNRAEAREQLGIPQSALLVLSMWGSLGANRMNRYMVDFIEESLRGDLAFHHLHAAGGSFGEMREELARRGIELPRRIRVEEYIYEMPAAMRAADLVLCRGGASTLSELTALGKAAIIVPSPNVPNDHQHKNAQVLEARGGARVIPEQDCDGVILCHETQRLLRESETRHEMERAMCEAGAADAGERIYQMLMKLMQNHSK